MINVIANAINSNLSEGGTIIPAPGLSTGETLTALKYWLGQKQGQAPGGDGNMAKIFSLADIPIGFIVEIDEIFPPAPDNVMITKYMNCWVVRYTRPIISSGDLLVAETADINAQYVSYSQGRAITSGSVEVVG